MPLEFASRLKNVETSAIRELFKLLGKPGIISFAGGFPDPALFDVDGIRMATEQVLRDNPGPVLQRVQPQIGQMSGLRIADDPEDTALLVKSIKLKFFVVDRLFFRLLAHPSTQSGKLAPQAVQRSAVATSMGPSTSRSPPVRPSTRPPTSARRFGEYATSTRL